MPLAVFTNCYINFLTEVFHYDKNTIERKYQEFGNPILQFDDRSRCLMCTFHIHESNSLKWPWAEARNINMNKN